MERILPTLISVLLTLCSLSAAAGGALPRVVFPADYVLAIDAEGIVTADVALLQVELHPDLIVSAERGTQFTVTPAGADSDSTSFRVMRGTVIVADLLANAVTRLAPGRYVITRKQGLASESSVIPDDTPESSSVAGNDPEHLTPGYRLSDAVMVQQQKYLDSLKVDVRDVNNILASILRSLVPRRQ
ncbi:MAG: hypothetical protein ABIK82_15205 [Pseudomonadota bacterium]